MCEIKLELIAKYTRHENTYGAVYNTPEFYDEFENFQVGINVDIIIHFPHIVIKNSVNQRTVIKDLFVKLPFLIRDEEGRDENRNVTKKFAITQMLGLRLTFSPNQYKSGYKHSHLRKFSYGMMGAASFTSFCLGSSDLRATFQLITGDYSEDIMQLLLLQVKPYLEWESLEGGPHMKMRDISDKGEVVGDVPDYTCEAIYQSVLGYMKDYLRLGVELPKVNWHYSNKIFRIVDDQSLEGFFGILKDLYSEYFYVRDQRGNYYRPKIIPNFYYTQNSCSIYFQGRKFVLTIEREDDGFDYSKKYIHPQIKKYVINRLESEATNSFIRESGLKRLSSYRNTRLRIQQNKVSVSGDFQNRVVRDTVL